MSQHCPHCQQSIIVPSLYKYDDYFTCPSCYSALAHHEADIMLFALLFVVLTTTSIVLFIGLNMFMTMLSTMLAYHFLRPKFFEPRFRLRIVKFVPVQDL